MATFLNYVSMMRAPDGPGGAPGARELLHIPPHPGSWHQLLYRLPQRPSWLEYRELAFVPICELALLLLPDSFLPTYPPHIFFSCGKIEII